MLKWLSYIVRHRNPSMVVPNLIYPSINDINFEDLKKKGIKTVIYDLDNTICLPELYTPFSNIEEKYFISTKLLNVLLLSNSIGIDDEPHYKVQMREWVEKNFKASLCIHKDKKPFCGDQVIKDYKLNPSEVLMIGDRLMTDVLFGNMNGFLTAYVEPLRQSAMIHIIIIRSIEYYLYNKYKDACLWKGKEQYKQ